MEILYLLLPLSLAVVALTGGVLWWAVFSGQYDDPDAAAYSILQDDDGLSRDREPVVRIDAMSDEMKRI